MSKALRWAALAIACAALARAPRATLAAESLGNRHRDPVHKFSFRVFAEWEPIPIEAGEKYEVCKYVQPGDRGVVSPQVVVYRLATGAAAKPVTTPAGDESPKPPPGLPPGIPPEVLERILGKPPASMLDLLNRRLADHGIETKLKAAGAKEVESKDDVPGSSWATSVGGRFGGLYMVFATWKKGDVEIGLWGSCADNQRRKYEAGFRDMIESFTWFDSKAKDVEAIDALDGLPITPGKRREIERGLVAGWKVIVSPRKNYIVIYNRKGRRNDLLAKTIAKNIEAIREQVYEVQFPPAKKLEAVSVCRVCGDKAEYHQYGGPGGSAGYWSPMSEELVFYDASPSRKIDDDTLSVLYHEAFHQYVFYSAGNASPHSWFNEGHGDYYAGAKLRGSKFRVGPFAWRVGVVKDAIRRGPCPYEEKKEGARLVRTWDRKSGGYSPLRALVEMDQGEYYSYPGVSYAQGWSLVYFLREIVPKNKKWQEKWGRILPTYFDTLKEEVARARTSTPKPPEPPEPSKPPTPLKPPRRPDEPEPADGGGPTTPPSPAPATPAPPPAAPAPTGTEPATPAPETPPAPTPPAPATPPAPGAPTDSGKPDPATPVPPTSPVPPVAPPAPPAAPAGGETPPPVPPAPETPPAPKGPEKGPDAPPSGPGKPPAPATPPRPPGDGDGDGDAPPPEEHPEDLMGIPQFRGSSDEDALRKALDAAFRGVDFDELEKAWAESILKVNG